MFASCRNIGDDRILACVATPAPGEKSAELENVGGPLTV
jgi:hypothetical protein